MCISWGCSNRAHNLGRETNRSLSSHSLGAESPKPGCPQYGAASETFSGDHLARLPAPGLSAVFGALVLWVSPALEVSHSPFSERHRLEWPVSPSEGMRKDPLPSEAPP